MMDSFKVTSYQLILEKLLDENEQKSYKDYVNISVRKENSIRSKDTMKECSAGFVVGPYLLNVLYNDLLLEDYLKGVTLIEFAGNVTVVAGNRWENMLKIRVYIRPLTVTNWMGNNVLEFAQHRTGGRSSLNENIATKS